MIERVEIDRNSVLKKIDETGRMIFSEAERHYLMRLIIQEENTKKERKVMLISYDEYGCIDHAEELKPIETRNIGNTGVREDIYRFGKVYRADSHELKEGE